MLVLLQDVKNHGQHEKRELERHLMENEHFFEQRKKERSRETKQVS